MGTRSNSRILTPTELKYNYITSKIKNIHMGYYTTYIETTDRRLFVFGNSTIGQLGLGKISQKETTPIEFIDDRITGKIKEMFVSSFSVYILTADGKLFAFGRNNTGQLSLGDKINKANPTEITDDRISGKIKKIYLLPLAMFLVTTDNRLFVSGFNHLGQLGLGDTKDRPNLTEVKDNRISGKIKKIYMGDPFVYISTTDNKLFVFGDNQYGQLGLGDKKHRTTPTEFTDDRISGKIKKIYMGDDAVYLSTTDNKLFVFGDNQYGQLGLGDTKNRINPTEFTDDRIIGKVKTMHSNGNRIFITTTDDRAFVAGRNNKGQLGLGDTKDRTSFVEFQIKK